jgi:hypothetical protein
MPFIQKSQVALFACLVAFGITHAQDSAVFDAKLNSWQLHYQDTETEQWVNRSYVARTAIRPSMQTRVGSNGSQYTYHYTLRNRRGAEQNVSVIRIWGIPLVYPVPGLPPVTANQRNDSEAWTHQYWAQLQFKTKFERSVVFAPKGWSAGLRVDEKENQTSFVWTPGLKDTDSDGVAPGHAQGGFLVVRPELPGVARAYLQGRIAEPWGLDMLPDTPFWTQKVDEIEEQDYLLVPVLAPIIQVPTPYSGAELARRLKTHVQTWLKYEHVSPAVLDRLNRQFDVLIPALEGNNKAVARAASIEMFKEAFGHHQGLTHRKLGEDDEDQAAEALHSNKSGLRGTAVNRSSQAVTFDRVAARALAFNLMYILERAEKVR